MDIMLVIKTVKRFEDKLESMRLQMNTIQATLDEMKE